MSALTMAFFVWGVMTAFLIGLLIYRGILGSREDDQLFLDRAEAAFEREQADVQRRLARVEPVIRWMAIASGGLLLAIVGWWFYNGLFVTPAMS